MTIQEAIQKAIEEGWRVNGIYNEASIKRFGVIGIAGVILREDKKMSFLLDPQFWQCLGKGSGWENKIYEKSYSRNLKSWLFHWHNFIDHLAEGKSIEDYFQTLIR